jgi:hypothetical protein
MDRTQLLEELVTLDAQIHEATSRSGQTTDDTVQQKFIDEVRELRKQRAEIKAKLDANHEPPALSG